MDSVIAELISSGTFSIVANGKAAAISGLETILLSAFPIISAPFAIVKQFFRLY